MWAYVLQGIVTDVSNEHGVSIFKDSCALKAKAAYSSETSLAMYQTTWRHISEDRVVITVERASNLG
jgi:type II secretory pathway component PulC